MTDETDRTARDEAAKIARRLKRDAANERRSYDRDLREYMKAEENFRAKWETKKS